MEKIRMALSHPSIHLFQANPSVCYPERLLRNFLRISPFSTDLLMWPAQVRMCSKATAVNQPMQSKANADTTLQNQPEQINKSCCSDTCWGLATCRTQQTDYRSWALRLSFSFTSRDKPLAAWWSLCFIHNSQFFSKAQNAVFNQVSTVQRAQIQEF